MYGQGGNFNPRYRHAAPPPPPPQQAGVTGGFPQQSLPPPPPQQVGVTGGFPQQSLQPLAAAQYLQPPAMQPPPGLYQQGMPTHQNQAYPYAQLSQMHQMPMPPQHRGFTQMPMPGPPLHQAMYQAPPQYPMPGSLPPPPPRPPSFAPKDALPPAGPPPPPPPPPPVPPTPPTAPTTVQSCSAAQEIKEGAPDGGRDVKIGEAQLIVSDDSDMDMDGDEDSPSRVHLSPVNSSLATAECNREVNVAKSVNDISSLVNDLPSGSGGKAKTANVTVEGGNPFQLIQGYASDDSEHEEHADAASNLVILPEAPCSEQNNEARNHQLKDENIPVKHNSDEPGHLVNKDLRGSESDGVQQSKRHGRSQRKRSHNQSPQGSRSCSPLGGNEHGPSQSSSPGRQSRSPLAKWANLHLSKSPHKVSRTCEAQLGVDLGISKDGFYNDKHDTPAKIAALVEIHLAGGGDISGNRIAEQEGLMGTNKLNSSSDDLSDNEEEKVAPHGTLGQHGHGEILISGSSQSMSASANASDPYKMQRPGPSSQYQSDLHKSSLAANQSLLSQSSSGVPFASVHATENSMACDVPGQMSSGFAPAHQSSSNMSLLPGQPLLARSEFPQTQFQNNAMSPANEFLQNQMSMYPAPDLSHPRPLDFNPHTLQPVAPPHQQPAAFHTDECKRPFPLDSATVPLPDRQSGISGGVGLPYSCHQSSYGQQQPPGSLALGANMVYPTSQRFPSNLPGSSDFGPISGAGLPKSSIKPHYNPFASTFEQTDPSLNIGPGVSPNAVGSASTKTAEHMNTLSPFGQSVPGSGTHVHESSAEAVPNQQKQSRPGFTSSAPYDPLLDSIEPSSSSINKMDVGQEANLSGNDSHNASKLVNIKVESKNMHGLGLVAESEVEELGEVAADTEAGVVENVSPEPLGPNDWSSDIPGDIDNDQSLEKSKKSKDSRSMKLFKIAIADFVKEVLKPSWRQGNMSREAYKTIVKKTVDKVSSSVPSNHIPKTPAKIKQYVQSSQKKVTKLVMGYVDKYVKL